MNLSRLFILRPVATTLAMLALLVTGLLGYRMLPVSALPQVDYPTIQVVTLYPGASPDVVAALITSPLERRFGSMSGLSQMSSSSSAGASRITLQFELGLSLDVAEQEVQAAISAAQNMLPNDLPAPPVYNKVNPADTPVLSLAITSPTMPLHEVRDLIDVRVAQKLSQVSGVGLVSVAGGQRPAVRLQLDPSALAASNLTLAQVRQAVLGANVNQPKGTLDGPERSISISANEQLRSEQDYENLIIAYQGGAAIRLGQLASVRRGPEDVRQAAWVVGQPAILLNIQRQPGANVISVVDSITERLPELRRALPVGVEVSVASDRTQTIRDSVRHVQKEMIMAIGLVVLVTFAFLRSWSATLIPGIVVPISLIATFAIMHMLGFSINNLTLMALTIATGFVVDDAIVMMENISRYIEKGESPLQAALKGAAQIGFTLLSLTISLVAVLIPLLFMSDVIGRLFREFAVTLAVAILLSLFISLTLTPMMCARMLKSADQEKPGRVAVWCGRQLDALIARYDDGLRWVLRHQTWTMLVALATFGLTALLYVAVPKGFFPQQDSGIIQAMTQGPQTASFAAMGRLQQKAVDIIVQDPDVEAVTAFIGVDGSNATLNMGRLQIALKPQGRSRAPAKEIIRRLDERLLSVPGLRVYLQPQQELTVDDQISPYAYQLALSDPDSAVLQAWTPQWLDILRALPELADATSDLQNEGLQVMLDIDRDAATRIGVSKAQIDDALYDAFGQRLISTIYTQSAQYRVVLEVDQPFRQRPEDLQHIYVLSSSGKAIPISSLARAQIISAPLSVERMGQFPVVNFSFKVTPGYSLSEAVQAIGQAMEQSDFPESTELRYLGSAHAFTSSLSNTLWLMLAAVVTMYIVLGILYESFIHPITILSTLPSATIGALLALLLAGRDLDMVGVIGIILLIGIVKKNAIMMIDFALEAQRNKGLSAQQAIHDAALLRFRPILMTTLAALFSALPLMFATGSGAELRQPLGLVMVGGLLCSQILTLFTTPVIYLWFDRYTRGRRSGATHGPESA